MLGQLAHFSRYREDTIPEAIKRFADESVRLYGVLDKQLSEHEFVAGEYSIADMAIYPWSAVAYEGLQAMLDLSLPNVERWHAAIAARPAVQRGMKVPAE